MAHNVTKFSDRGLAYQSGVDVGALTMWHDGSAMCKPRPVIAGTAAAGQNADGGVHAERNRQGILGPVGGPGRSRRTYISGRAVARRRVAVGGTRRV
jgi:hypothetical protein